MAKIVLYVDVQPPGKVREMERTVPRQWYVIGAEVSTPEQLALVHWLKAELREIWERTGCEIDVRIGYRFSEFHGTPTAKLFDDLDRLIEEDGLLDELWQRFRRDAGAHALVTS